MMQLIPGLGIVKGMAVTLRRFFEPGMHRAHQRTIFQRSEAEVERGEQVRVGWHGEADCRDGYADGRALV